MKIVKSLRILVIINVFILGEIILLLQSPIKLISHRDK